MLFLNYKLLLVVRKCRRGKPASPDVKKSFLFKNISSCLLAVASYVTFISIPGFLYIGLKINSKGNMSTLGSLNLARYWAITIVLMNSTFNCLIFFWKNKVLRAEGRKVLKRMKMWR